MQISSPKEETGVYTNSMKRGLQQKWWWRGEGRGRGTGTTKAHYSPAVFLWLDRGIFSPADWGEQMKDSGTGINKSACGTTLPLHTVKAWRRSTALGTEPNGDLYQGYLWSLNLEAHACGVYWFYWWTCLLPLPVRPRGWLVDGHKTKQMEALSRGFLTLAVRAYIGCPLWDLFFIQLVLFWFIS